MPTFFSFLSLLCILFSFSPLSGTLHWLPIFISQIYLLLFMYSITDYSAACSLSSQITIILNLNQVKDFPSWESIWCHIFIMYWHHVSMLSLFWFHQSCPFSNIMDHVNSAQCREPYNSPPHLESAIDTDSPPCMPSRRGRWQRSPHSSPKSGGPDRIHIMDWEDLMAWFDQDCTSPPPPYELPNSYSFWFIILRVGLWCWLWKWSCQEILPTQFLSWQSKRWNS